MPGTVEDAAPGQPPHVVLVGLMGVGKSSAGRKLARLLDRPFVDADEFLELREGRTVRRIFGEDGEAAFRSRESTVLDELLATPGPLVIAAGGGVVVTPANRRRLARPDAFVVYMTATPAFLASRVAQSEHRPLVADDPLGTLTRLAGERGPWYEEVADAMVDIADAWTDPKPKAALAAQIAALVPGVLVVPDVTAAPGAGPLPDVTAAPEHPGTVAGSGDDAAEPGAGAGSAVVAGA
jgi:shikimate kinase